MEKTISSIFFSYITPIGFIIWGIYLIKIWRKPLKSDVSDWDKSTHGVYLINGIGAIFGGIIFFIISISQACTGWVAK